MILRQDVYQAIRPLEYFAADEKCSPFAVRLPIGWVLSGPLPSSSNLVPTCFKADVEQDYDLACQRLSLDMIWNRTARTSRLTHDPQRMLARRKYLNKQLFITAKDTMSVCYGLMTTSNSRITNFRHWYSSSLSKNGSRETQYWLKIMLITSVKTWKKFIWLQPLTLTSSSSGQIKSGTYHIIP